MTGRSSAGPDEVSKEVSVTKSADGTTTATSSRGGTATRNGTTTTVTKDGVTKSFDNTKKPTRPRKNK